MLTRPRLPALLTSSILLLLVLVLVLPSGCSDRGGTLAPDRLSQGATALASVREGDPATAPRAGIYRRMWPHEDGRSWTFRYVSRTWDSGAPQFYPTPEEVPTITLDEAAALLEADPAGPDPTTTLGTYGLRFNGRVTTLSGVTAQNLEESLALGGAARVPSPGDRAVRAFLRLLARARPDLAAKLAAQGVEPARVAGAAFLPDPTLLHGYAWEQNEDWIGNYGDLNREVSWIYLTSHLGTGAEFTLQLVPDLADDVFLHARMLGPRRVATDAGTFPRAFEVLYLVDFGVSLATDANGNPLGYFRSYLVGTVDYAAGVGPVRSYERLSAFFGGGVSDTDGDIALSLTATGTNGGTLAAR